MNLKWPVVDGQKQCADCLKWKDLSQYPVNNKVTQEPTTCCRECRSLRYHTRYKASAVPRNRQRIYGITPEDYDALYQAQGGVCAVCKQAETRVVKGTLTSLNVDHCHTTGRIRGLLCTKCNRGLGLFNDDSQRLLNMVEYLNSEGDSEICSLMSKLRCVLKRAKMFRDLLRPNL